MSLALAGVMVMSMGVTAFAADGDMAQPGKALAADEIADAVVASGEISAKNNKHYYEIDSTGDTERPYSAHGASSVVVLNAEPTMFKAIVPIALHVSQDPNMDKTYADSMETGKSGTAKIANLCKLGQIKVTDVQVVAATGYTITDFENGNYENMLVNSKNFGFKINGLNVIATGQENAGKLAGFTVGTKTITSSLKESVDENDGKTELERTYDEFIFTREDSNTEAFPIIAHASVLPIYYEAKLPGFSAAVTNANVGAVVFTLDFNTAPNA